MVAYTSDPAFAEPHAGPLVVCGNGYTSGERSTWTVGQMMHRSGARPVNEESQPTHVPHGLPVEYFRIKPRCRIKKMC
jgi:hypothetical protein